MPLAQERILDADVTEDQAHVREDTEQRPAPTWFPQSFREMPSTALAERYRSVRGVAEPAAISRPVIRPSLPPQRLLQASRYSSEVEELFRVDAQPASRPRDIELRQRQPRQRQQQNSAAYLLAGVAAVIIGGGLGYAATQYRAISGAAHQLTATAAIPTTEPLPAAVAAVNRTVIARKPVATATLNVSDVSGGLNSMIPLLLHAEPATAGQDIFLKISGLPQSAYLTAGSRRKDNDWQLAAADADDVKLVVPQSEAPEFDVDIAAIETKTGELAAPIKQITVAITDPQVKITPASAAPDTVTLKPALAVAVTAETQPVPAPKLQQAAAAEAPAGAQNLVAKGDILLKSGDMAMARQFYEQAFALGAPAEAALGAGKTYDPVVYADLKVQGLKPDPARAMEWYLRASAAGSSAAAQAIATLKQAQP